MSVGFKYKVLIDFKAKNAFLKMMGFGIHQNFIQFVLSKCCVFL